MYQLQNKAQETVEQYSWLRIEPSPDEQFVNAVSRLWSGRSKKSTRKINTRNDFGINPEVQKKTYQLI